MNLLTGNLIILIISALYGSVKCLEINKIPAKFDDIVLPSGQRDGPYIEHLGHILKLDTFLSPKKVDKYKTTMSLYNRRMVEPKNFVFQPKQYCIPGVCHGPFQYDLNELSQAGFDPNLRTIVMIPGFLTDDNVPWMNRARNSWLELEDVNIILVTWKNSNRYIYSTAVADTPLVARQITIFLYYLAELHGLHLSDEYFAKSLHFVAHSLGAHVAGFVGQDLGGRLGRITGLDPAGPSFDMMPSSKRLDPSDALLVDVIHTNAGKMHYANLMASSLLEGTNYLIKKIPLLGRVVNYIGSNYNGEGDTSWLGIDAKLGHIDYYANNGRVQPGCGDLLHVCDHGRSTDIVEDILRHEVSLKRASINREFNRLLAIRSNNYEDFISGRSLARKCPSTLKSVRRNSSYSLEMCSLPLDLISPVDELKSEFSSVYNLDLTHQSQDGFYFSTNSESPFVNDHLLLKVGINDWSDWKENCGLRIEIVMKDLSKVVQFSEHLPMIKDDDFFGIAVPFVSSTDKLVRPVLDLVTNTSSLAQAEPLMDILPAEIRLMISSRTSKGFFDSARKQLTKMLTFGYFDKPSAKCKLYIRSLEVVPIMEAQKQQVVASYGPQISYGNGESIQVKSLSDRGGLVTESQKFQLEPSSSKGGIVRKLNALLVG